MNRLYIIGNGFDLHFGIKSSYKHFVAGFLCQTLIQARNNLKIESSLIAIPKNPAMINPFDLEYSNAFKDINGYANRNFNIKSSIISETINEIDKHGWADIERIYFKKLIQIMKANTSNKPQSASEKNKELSNILQELSKYLTQELIDFKQKNGNKRINLRVIEPYFEIFDFNESTYKSLKSKSPDNILILNFNYTNLFDNCNSSTTLTKVDIHGKLNDPNNPILFGYGDETDENYLKMEKFDEDVWLQHIKSFYYLKTREYDKIVDFIEMDEYQVCVVGHSCGISDKVLLSQIFQHDNCRNLKVYYKKWDDGTDNFNDISFNISRLMTDKNKLRKIFAKKHKLHEFNNIPFVFE
jgi:hypothetical protein